VRRLWHEIAVRYRNFEFVHSGGLGVAHVGRELRSDHLETMLGAASDAEITRIRAYFAQLGTSIIDRLAHKSDARAPIAVAEAPTARVEIDYRADAVGTEAEGLGAPIQAVEAKPRPGHDER
jgi:hypothetical protein